MAEEVEAARPAGSMGGTDVSSLGKWGGRLQAGPVDEAYL
jgi:hypothetical protein